MMTLQELLSKVDKTALEKKTPGVAQLIEYGCPVICSEKMGDEIQATVFQNGYVLYRNGAWKTVFSIDRCKDYVEKSVSDEEQIIPFEIFVDLPWQLRVMMEGERRLVHNTFSYRNYFKDVFYDACGRGADAFSDEGAGDPLFRLIEEELREEEITKLETIMDSLTERQRFVLIQCVVKGRMQNDVANEIGTTRSNVSKILSYTLNKIRKAYGIQDNCFKKNLFYRPIE